MTKIKIANLFLHAVLLTTLMAALVSFTSAQTPPKDGSSGPGGCVWKTENFRVTGGGSNSLYIKAGVTAFITNSTGSPSFRGGYLTITSSRAPFWFGRSSVINEYVPGNRATRRFYLAIYQGKNPPNTVVYLRARYCS